MDRLWGGREKGDRGEGETEESDRSFGGGRPGHRRFSELSRFEFRYG